MPVRIPFVSGLPALAAMLLLLPGAALSVEAEPSNDTSAAHTVAAETHIGIKCSQRRTELSVCCE